MDVTKIRMGVWKEGEFGPTEKLGILPGSGPCLSFFLRADHRQVDHGRPLDPSHTLSDTFHSLSQTITAHVPHIHTSEHSLCRGSPYPIVLPCCANQKLSGSSIDVHPPSIRPHLSIAEPLRGPSSRHPTLPTHTLLSPRVRAPSP